MHLDHTVVPAKNSQQSAQFYSEILGLTHLGHHEPFEVVGVDQHLKLLFLDKQHIDSRHYAFIVTEQEYAAILSRVKQHPYLVYGDRPSNRHNGLQYHSEEQTGFYFDDEDGHILEVIKNN